ncbi:MAG TPA: ADOP family duplicated permease [Gemmatimonadaceae bacterium]|nr:ADOP family duplicated permease [Gemmatimonadaceae bacterium]
MPSVRTIRDWWWRVRHREAAERELDEELQFHVDMHAEQGRRLGLGTAEARRRALVALGGRERFKEEMRDERGGRWLEDAGRDLRLGLRALRRAPGYAAAAVASLALGIGAATAVFTLAYAVLLKPLPYPRADRLVAVGHAAPGFGVERGGLSDGTYLHYRAHSRTLADLGAYLDRVLNLTGGDEPELVDAALVTPNLFGVLGARPLLGRVFSDAADGPGAPPTVVLSHALWVRRYGADPRIVGRTIEINRLPREVVGVMPPDFHFPGPRTQLWFAFPVEPASSAGLRNLYLTGVGRLRAGVEPSEAAAELQHLAATLPYADAAPERLAQGGVQARVVPLRKEMTRDVRPALVLILGTTAFVLLVAWANVANLALVRAERRRREVAMARALGAATRHVARRALAEAALVAAAGGVIGLAVARVGAGLRFGFSAGELPRLHELRVDGVVLAVAVGLTLASALVLTAVTLAAGHGAGYSLLRGTGRATAGREARWTQRLLVALQVALSLTLLIGATVMARSYRQLRAAELGFDPTRVLAFDLELPFRPYPTYRASAAFYADVLARIRELPGVVDAEAADLLPLTTLPEVQLVAVATEDAAPGSTASETALGLATPGYFAAMRIPLLAGRGFERADLAAAEPGVMVSAAFARAHVGGTTAAVGRRLRIGERRAQWFRIVGVVGDVPGATIAAGARRAVYLPVLSDPPVDSAQAARLPLWPGAETIVVRTTVPPGRIVPAVRRAVHAVDAKVPIARVRTLERVVDGALARARLVAWLLAAAAGTTLLLGVIGIYGVLSYAVSLRTSEFGLRIALGTPPAAVGRMVLRQGVAVTLVGIVAGAGAALALTRLLRGLLYQVSPHDPAAFAAMPALLLAVALVACWMPARRAARADPAAALRAE